MLSEEQVLKMKGTVTHFETDLAGNEIEGTRVEDHNSIGTALKYYLANSIADNVDEALDDPFILEPAVTLNKDGIALFDNGPGKLTYAFDTALNTGGTGAEAYAEFYGVITGAVTLIGDLQLGWKATSVPDFTSVFASYTINKSVAANRRYHFYWKITIG